MTGTRKTKNGVSPLGIDTAASGVTTPEDVWDETNRLLHERTLYPTIRVRTEKVQGSGTIIYSKARTEPDDEGELGFSTYALTNHHVIADLIRVEKKYDYREGKEITRDYRDLAQVEVFAYKNRSTITGRTTTEAEIVAYREKRDIALLRFRDNRVFDFAANLLPFEDAKNVHIYDKLVLVGCGLGQPPFPTTGMLTGKDVMIDYNAYWQTSAPSIFGNSGGSVFIARSLQMIGIPSRISVRGGFLMSDTITHIGYFCPPTEIHRFLRDEGYHFLIDPTHTEAQDLKALAEKAEKGDDDADDE